MDKRKIAATSTLLFSIILCFGIVLFFTESPVFLFSQNEKQKNSAAIAIRDNVIPFQKFGTRLFTFPYLENKYTEVIYLTEYKPREKRKEFIEGLNKLLSNYEKVDIYLLAHANSYFLWVNEVDSTKRKKIRLVYNTGCSGADQAEVWLRLGAKSYVAHRSNESISPVFYFYFLRRWCAGQTLQTAVVEANKYMFEKLKRIELISFKKIKVDSVILRESVGNRFGKTDYTINE